MRQPPPELLAEWEKKLASEGMPATLKRKQIRSPRSAGYPRTAISREISTDLIEIKQADPIWGMPDTWLQAAISHNPYTETQRMSKEELQPLKEALRDAIEALEEPHRTLMIAYASGASVREAGELVGMPYSTAHSKITAARNQLREQLRNHPAVTPHLGDPDA